MLHTGHDPVLLFPFCPSGCSVFPRRADLRETSRSGKKTFTDGHTVSHRSRCRRKRRESVRVRGEEARETRTQGGQTESERAHGARAKQRWIERRAESTEQRTGNRDTEHRTTTGHTRHRRTHHSRERVTRDYHGITGTLVRLRSYPDISAAPFVSFSP